MRPPNGQLRTAWRARLALLPFTLVALHCSIKSPAGASPERPPPSSIHLRPDAGPPAVAAPSPAATPPEAAAIAGAASITPPTPPPPSGTTALPLPSFLPSLVSWPQTDRWPQPLLIAAHGAGDSAESQCEVWRELLGPHGVVLCLRGKAMDRRSPQYGFYFPDHLELEREFTAAMESLVRAHPGLVDAQRSLYAGYSQGGQMGLLMLLGRGAQVPRLLLVEGGAGDWTLPRVRRFKRSGGERVAILCGTPGCAQRATASAARLEAAGLRSYAHYVPGGGHTYGGSMLPELRKAFAELTEDDPRWQP